MPDTPPRISLDADQEAFDAWFRAMKARTEDLNDDFMEVDLNDMVMVFITARLLARDYPDRVPALMEWTPEAVERAGRDLGIFMGVSWLANKVGISPEVARDACVGIWRVGSDG